MSETPNKPINEYLLGIHGKNIILIKSITKKFLMKLSILVLMSNKNTLFYIIFIGYIMKK